MKPIIIIKPYKRLSTKEKMYGVKVFPYTLSQGRELRKKYKRRRDALKAGKRFLWLAYGLRYE